MRNLLLGALAVGLAIVFWPLIPLVVWYFWYKKRERAAMLERFAEERLAALEGCTEEEDDGEKEAEFVRCIKAGEDLPYGAYDNVRVNDAVVSIRPDRHGWYVCITRGRETVLCAHYYNHSGAMHAIQKAMAELH